MANPLLGQILGSVFSSAMRGRGQAGPFGGGGLGGSLGGGGLGGGMGGGVGGGLGGIGGAGLGGLLGGLMGGGRGRGGLGGGNSMLLMMLLPIAMQWVQRNGGIGAVLDRFRQRGYQQHAASWVGTGENEAIEPDAIDSVVGRDEISRIASQLGVPEHEVANGFAEILPEMTNQLTPQGDVPPEADEALNGGLSELEQALSQIGADRQLA